MRLVVDAVAVRPGSAAVVIGGVIAGWTAAAPNDELVVLVDGHPDFPVPPTVAVESIARRGTSVAGRLWTQSVRVRRACRRHRADALLSAITASAYLGAGRPRGAIVYDLRHELRPGQFTLVRRLSRRIMYEWTFRRADALFCISARTRADLVARRPYLQDKTHVALLGADHAAGWRASPDRAHDYVLAFGHLANKNVDGVLRAWKLYTARHGALTLRICGLSDAARTAAQRLVRELGVGDRVELMPWLSNAQFESVFAGAAAVLFPSDFEGFGLPPVEAMLLGVPVVISKDPALLEVTAGHAAVAQDDSADALAAALAAALALSAGQLEAARAHAQSFTWERCARAIRAVLAGPDSASSAPHAGVLDVASAN